MVVGSGIARRVTRIGGKNKFALVGAGLAIYLLLSKRGQGLATTGIPLVSGAGVAVGETIESVLPLDILGREIGALGSGFSEFGVGIGSGISGIFSPITNFIDWTSNLVGFGSKQKYSNPSEPSSQVEELVY